MQTLTTFLAVPVVLAIGCQPVSAPDPDAGGKGDSGPFEPRSCFALFTECSLEALAGELEMDNAPRLPNEHIEGRFAGVEGSTIRIETDHLRAPTVHLRMSADPTPLTSILDEEEAVVLEVDFLGDRLRLLRASDGALLAMMLRNDSPPLGSTPYPETIDASDELDVGAASVELRPGACGHVRELGYDCAPRRMTALDVAFLDADGEATVVPLGATVEVSTSEGRFSVHNLWSTMESPEDPAPGRACQFQCGVAIFPTYAVDIVRVE